MHCKSGLRVRPARARTLVAASPRLRAQSSCTAVWSVRRALRSLGKGIQRFGAEKANRPDRPVDGMGPRHPRRLDYQSRVPPADDLRISNTVAVALRARTA